MSRIVAGKAKTAEVAATDSTQRNVRGAEFLELLARYDTESAMLAFMKSVGMLDTMMGEVEEQSALVLSWMHSQGESSKWQQLNEKLYGEGTPLRASMKCVLAQARAAHQQSKRG
ncbi:MAG: hypothetical protein NT091_01925 [Candidatus Falkowbacteria bacterium]|nr:hypothetical protein [Candidatus Falkowbacteria bacterium]